MNKDGKDEQMDAMATVPALLLTRLDFVGNASRRMSWTAALRAMASRNPAAQCLRNRNLGNDG